MGEILVFYAVLVRYIFDNNSWFTNNQNKNFVKLEERITWKVLKWYPENPKEMETHIKTISKNKKL